MSCKQITSLIIEHVDGTLDELQNQAVVSHVKTCIHCKNLVRDEQLLQHSFKSLSETQAPKDFHNAVFAGISEKSSHASSYFAGFSSAIAASLVLWLIFFPTQEMKSQINPAIAGLATASTIQPRIEIAINDVENIQLSFEVPSHFQQVTFSVKLPEQIELKGFPGQQNISWKTPLTEGINILTLPVTAKSIGEGVIEAKISNQHKSKVFKIRMIAKPGKQASLAIAV